MQLLTKLLLGANVAVFALEAVSGPGFLATFALWPVGHFTVAQFESQVGFSMLFPSRTIVLIFPPIPMPAIVFVIIYGLIELFSGIFGTQQGVAHFTTLAGCWALTSPSSLARARRGHLLFLGSAVTRQHFIPRI